MRREQARRRRQIRAGQIAPSYLKADLDVLDRSIEAVGHGTHDGTLDAATFDALEDVLGRMLAWHPIVRRTVVINSRFVRPNETRLHYMCKGQAIFREAEAKQ